MRSIQGLFQIGGCTDEEIDAAQKALGIVFPQEYVDYVKAFGAVSFAGAEWTGLHVKGYLNVVEATEQEKSVNPDFPKDCFVLENCGIDAILTVVDQAGRVYSLQRDRREKLCDSLSDYLDMRLAGEA